MNVLKLSSLIALCTLPFWPATETVGADNVTESTSIVSYRPVDWTSIRINSEDVRWTYERAAIQGFLKLEGEGDSPSITLWDTRESREVRKTFSKISVDSESASELINAQFGSGVESWRVLDGLFVEVYGKLTRTKAGNEYVGLGRLSEISRIEVLNNGLTLISLVKRNSEEADNTGDTTVEDENPFED